LADNNAVYTHTAKASKSNNAKPGYRRLCRESRVPQVAPREQSQGHPRVLSKEMELAWNKLSDDAIFLVDDIDWSNAFYAFVSAKRLYPVLFTDNGKDNLRVRTGVVSKKHIRNSDPAFT
jgi:hypothetical protein